MHGRNVSVKTELQNDTFSFRISDFHRVTPAFRTMGKKATTIVKLLDQINTNSFGVSS